MISPSNPLASNNSLDRQQFRLHGLDALRAFATLLVVMLHAAVPYLVQPMPGLPWPTRDISTSVFVDATFWWIESFIMPLFFLLSGFLAAGLLASKGPREFLRHRRKRLLLPLLVGCVIVLPADLYIWLLGWVIDGTIPLFKMRTLKFDGNLDAHLWGLSHLWFLQYLFLYCVGYALIHGMASRFQVQQTTTDDGDLCHDTILDRALQSAWKPLIAAVPGAILLWFAPEVVTGFQHGFLPFPAKFLYTIPFFAVGTWMHHHKGSLRMLVRRSRFYLAASAGLFALLLPNIHAHLTAELFGLNRVVLAATISLFAWLTVLGLFGLFLNVFDRVAPTIRYLAEASLWIYLVHHPIVALTPIVLKPISLPPTMKFIIVTSVAFAFSLMTYQIFVRFTWLGAVLNGRRLSRTNTVLMPSPPEDHRSRSSSREEATRPNEAA